MSKPTKQKDRYPLRRLLCMDEAQKKAVRWWRNKRMLTSDAEAMRDMMWYAYSAEMARREAKAPKAKAEQAAPVINRAWPTMDTDEDA